MVIRELASVCLLDRCSNSCCQVHILAIGKEERKGVLPYKSTTWKLQIFLHIAYQNIVTGSHLAVGEAEEYSL